MDMSKFDVILGMDWLMAHQVVIDCDRRRVTAYTPNNVCVMFQWDKHDALPPGHMAWAVDGLASKPYLGGRS